MSTFIVISLDFGSEKGQDFLLWLEFAILGLKYPKGTKKLVMIHKKAKLNQINPILELQTP
jgi:hypothetical protein